MASPGAAKALAKKYNVEPDIAGNLDLHSRPVVHNPDGRISTVRSITAGFDGKTYVLPTVIGDRIVPDAEAIEHFRQTGEHLGAFNSLKAAEAYSQRLHEEQAKEYPNKARGGRIDKNKLAAKYGSISAYKPSVRERAQIGLEDLYARVMGQEPGYEPRQFIEKATGLLDFVPGVGEALGVDETKRALDRKRYLEAGLTGVGTALGAVPIVGDVAGKAVKGAAKGAEKLAAKAAVAAPAVARNRGLAADVLAEAASKNKNTPTFADWRAANEGSLGTLFDYSRLNEVPDVPQTQMPRYAPARGPSERIVSALADPRVVEGLNATVERGAQNGGLGWYNTEPLLERTRSAVGTTDAPAVFARLMDTVAATSPRAKVADNIRTASYYNYLRANGLPLPETPAPGYGSVAQNLHTSNVKGLEELGGWDVFKNPKPASFSTNLQGNQNNVTIDTHNMRLPGVLSEDPRMLAPGYDELVKPAKGEKSISREKVAADLLAKYPNMKGPDLDNFLSKLGKKKVTYRPRDWVASGSVSMDEALKQPTFWDSVPKDNEYGYYEAWQQDQAKKMGMSPAQYQASMWLGGAEDTGLGSTPEPFLKTFEARVRYTADRLGLPPEVVLEQMLKGETPLLAKGGHVDKAKLAAKYAC
jgi:hypothetical protein